MTNYWYYWHFKSVVSKENCNRILELGKEKLARQQLSGISTAATTQGGNTKEKMPDGVAQSDKTIQETQGTKTYVRDSTTCFLNAQAPWQETFLIFIKMIENHQKRNITCLPPGRRLVLTPGMGMGMGGTI